MIRGIFTAAAGMLAESLRADVTANNLANVNTAGFKKDFAVLSDVPIEQAEAIHKWLGEVIDATKKGDPVTISTPKPDIQHHIDNLLVFTKSKKAVGH